MANVEDSPGWQSDLERQYQQYADAVRNSRKQQFPSFDIDTAPLRRTKINISDTLDPAKIMQMAQDFPEALYQQAIGPTYQLAGKFIMPSQAWQTNQNSGKLVPSLLLAMDPVYVPKLTVSYTVDVEVACNTFNGKTADEIADFIQDEIHDMLFDIEQVVGVTSDLTALYSNNDEHWLPPWLWSQGRS